MSLASCPSPLPVSSLLLRYRSSCVLGAMPEGVDLLSGSLLRCLPSLPLYTPCPCGGIWDIVSALARGIKGFPRELLSRRIQRDGGVKAGDERSGSLLCIQGRVSRRGERTVGEADLFVRCSDLGPLVALVPVGEGAFQSSCQASLLFPGLPLCAISCFQSRWEKTGLLLGELQMHRGN